MDFKVVKYKDIGKVKSGKRLPRGYTVSEKITKNKYIRVRDINDGYIDASLVQYITDDAAQKINNYRVNAGDVIISVVGTIGSIAQIEDALNGAYLTENCDNLLVDESICIKEYLKYYLLSGDGLKEITANTVGSTQPKLPIYGIENFNIKLPSIEIQKKIVFLLESIENKIKLNNQINDNLQELGQKLLLNDLNDESCISYRLEEIFYHISPGTNYQPERLSDGVPFLNVKNINNGYIDYSDSKFISLDDYKKVHKTWQPEENDLLISRIGTLGLVAVIRKEDLPLAVHYNFLDLKTNKIPFELGYFLLKSDYFQNKYKFNIKNSVQEYVTVDDIKKIECKIPNFNCFNKYKVLYNTILNIQRENRTLVKLRDTLLPKLINGEIDLENVS